MCRPFDACSPQCPAQTWDLNWGQSQCRRRQWISGGYNGGCSIAIIERWIQPRSIYSIHERKCRGWPRILEDLIRREERPMTCSSNLSAWDWVLCEKLEIAERQKTIITKTLVRPEIAPRQRQPHVYHQPHPLIQPLYHAILIRGSLMSSSRL